MIDVTNSWSLSWELVVRLLGAAVLGGLIGAEREATEQPAGLRTHIAVALGAALFGAISTLGFQEFDRPRSESTLQADVTRVASNVAVGIGFLGAGLIFRQGNTVKNLTTGASLWTVAAIGLAAGVGDLTMAAVATAVLLASLVALRPVRTLLRRWLGNEGLDLRVTLRDDGRGLAAVVDALGSGDGVVVDHMEIDRGDDGTVVTARVRGHGDDAAPRRLAAALAGLPGVSSVSEESGAT